MAPPKFSDIVKDPDFQQLTDVEKQQVADRYYENVVNKDPEFKQLRQDEQTQVYNRLYRSAGLGQVQLDSHSVPQPTQALQEPQLDTEDPSIPSRKPLQGHVEKKVTFQEGLGNLANAVGGGLGAAGHALIDPNTYKNLASQAGKGIQTEIGTARQYAQPSSIGESMRRTFSPYFATQAGMLNTARDIAQLPISIWSDIGNAYEGRKVYKPAFELPHVQELPVVGNFYKQAMQEHPVFNFTGEQVPYLIPITRAGQAGELGKLGNVKELTRAAAEAAVAGAAADPNAQGLQGRIANAAAGLSTGLGVGAGAMLDGAGKVMSKEIPAARLDIKGRVAREVMPKDLTVQELGQLHPLDTAVPNNTNPITGVPYTREIGASAKDSAQAIKQNLADMKTATQIYKDAARDFETKAGKAIQMTGASDIAEAQRSLGKRINELEPKANTGSMNDAEATELMNARTALDELLQAGKNMNDAKGLLDETSTAQRASLSPVEALLDAKTQVRGQLAQHGGKTDPDALEIRNKATVAKSQLKELETSGAFQSTEPKVQAAIKRELGRNGVEWKASNDTGAPSGLQAIPNGKPRQVEITTEQPGGATGVSKELDYLFQNSKPVDAELQPSVSKQTATARVIAQPKLQEIGPRPAEASQPSAPKTRELGFVTTVKNAAVTAPEVKEKVSGEYNPITNQETMQRAKEIVQADPEAAYKQVMREEHPTAETYATAQELMRRYQNDGDYESAAELAETIAERATKQGQAIQALSMWGRLSPEGAMVTAERLAKKAGLGESKTAVSSLVDAVDRFRKSGDRKTAAQIKDFANKTSRASFKKALAQLTQEQLDNLGKVLGC